MNRAWMRRACSLTLAITCAAVLVCACGDSSNGEGNGTPDANGSSFDILIKNGRVMDPLTEKDMVAAIGIQGGKIGIITSNSDEVATLTTKAKRVIDATDSVVSPGFINTHTHEGEIEESMKVFVKDGITTWIGGNCGSSHFPLSEYYQQLEQEGMFNNYATLTGLNRLREEVGIDTFAGANEAQIAEMVERLDVDMAEGSLGISFGAYYNPGCTYEEMLATALESARLGGMVATHLRDNLYNVFDIILGAALFEAIDIAREADIPLLISHLTDITHGRGTTGFALGVVSQAIHAKEVEDRLRLAVDVIGADSLPNDFFTIARYGTIPLDILIKVAGVDITDFQFTDDVYINGELYMRAYEYCQSIEQAQTLMDAILAGEAESPGILAYIIKPANTMLALAEPFVFVGNDGSVTRDPVTGELLGHPRAAGAFARMIGHWSRDMGVMNLMQALYKATAAPALWFGLESKGRIQVGCDADLVIFDPQTILDTAKCEPGHFLDTPDGISHVIVNGEIVVQDKELTGSKPGRVIRRTWQIPGTLKGVE